MKEDILISVVMCVYNTPQEYLDTAVESILRQTHTNLELLIVDDASETDLYTSELYADPRIRIFRNQTNKGPSYSRNIALSAAKGIYIAIMDSDDFSYPERLEKQLAFMEARPDVVVCGTWFRHFGEKTNVVKRDLGDPDFYRCCLLFGNVPTLLNPSAMIRKSVLDEYEIRYDERLRKGEDYKIWVQLSRFGVCTNLTEVLMDYRIHKTQASQRLRTKDVSPYDWIVIREQLAELGLELSASEEAMLQKDFKNAEVDDYEYFKWLNRLSEANRKHSVYVQEKLEQRIREQWAQKVYQIKNPLKLIRLLRRLNAKERRWIWKTEFGRIKGKFKKGSKDDLS